MAVKFPVPNADNVGMDKNFVIKCQTDRYGGKWCVFHPDWRDGKSPCTEGSVGHCLQYVKDNS